jgi:hypothetical protein
MDVAAAELSWQLRSKAGGCKSQIKGAFNSIFRSILPVENSFAGVTRNSATATTVLWMVES